ncbi:MAG: hypothetical protein E7178_03320 [Erysipelotrichaceae bacterium]|nr:hypothetical protein [Erysipelotrichaceae bacterium]
MKWFNSQSRLVQLILLLIPFVNWIVEIFVRVTAVVEKPSTENILGVIFGLIIPVFGWIDLIWVLLFNHLCLCK